MLKIDYSYFFLNSLQIAQKTLSGLLAHVANYVSNGTLTLDLVDMYAKMYNSKKHKDVNTRFTVLWM